MDFMHVEGIILNKNVLIKKKYIKFTKYFYCKYESIAIF